MSQKRQKASDGAVYSTIASGGAARRASSQGVILRKHLIPFILVRTAVHPNTHVDASELAPHHVSYLFFRVQVFSELAKLGTSARLAS